MDTELTDVWDYDVDRRGRVTEFIELTRLGIPYRMPTEIYR